MSENFHTRALTQSTFVAMDIETTGKYPLGSEICEIAAVKAVGRTITDRFHSLVKPTQPMSKEVIAIHHITDEMVADAPAIADVIGKFCDFIGDGFVVAHHAPFDMGFLAADIERVGRNLPPSPGFCTSILAQKYVTETTNFRLKTLVEFYKIPLLNAHRATDDAEACLQVFFQILDKIGWLMTIEDLLTKQETKLDWNLYSINTLMQTSTLKRLIEAIGSKQPAEFIYDSGSRPGVARTVFPIGLVRNPKGDFLVAEDGRGTTAKRYFMDKIR